MRDAPTFVFDKKYFTKLNMAIKHFEHGRTAPAVAEGVIRKTGPA